LPMVVRCRGCGSVLLHAEELPAAEWYLNVYAHFNGHCQDCKRKLPSPMAFKEAINVEVKPNSATLNKSALVSAFHHDYHNEVAET